jgi:AraC family transcriptional regulator
LQRVRQTTSSSSLGRFILSAAKMKLHRGLANNLQLRQSSKDTTTISPHDFSPGGPEASSRILGSFGLQLSHHRALETDEIRIDANSQHVIVLFTKPPIEMNIRCPGVNRKSPPPLGSIALMPAGAVADVSWRGSKDCLQIYVEPALVKRVAARSFERDLSSAMPPLDAFFAPELGSAMLAIEAESAAGGLGGPLLLESLSNILTVHLIHHVFGFRQAAVPERGVLPRRKLIATIDYIMANLDNAPTLERMAELVHLSPDHFARQFKAATGLAPYQFVIKRRVERAQQLLRGRQELSLAEVAITAGFSDQSQLCFHFKRIAGVTPGQFRMSRIA